VEKRLRRRDTVTQQRVTVTWQRVRLIIIMPFLLCMFVTSLANGHLRPSRKYTVCVGGRSGNACRAWRKSNATIDSPVNKGEEKGKGRECRVLPRRGPLLPEWHSLPAQSLGVSYRATAN
jgi:hypothetical protein